MAFPLTATHTDVRREVSLCGARYVWVVRGAGLELERGRARTWRAAFAAAGAAARRLEGRA